MDPTHLLIYYQLKYILVICCIKTAIYLCIYMSITISMSIQGFHKTMFVGEGCWMTWKYQRYSIALQNTSTYPETHLFHSRMILHRSKKIHNITIISRQSKTCNIYTFISAKSFDLFHLLQCSSFTVQCSVFALIWMVVKNHKVHLKNSKLLTKLVGHSFTCLLAHWLTQSDTWQPVAWLLT